MSKRRWVRVFVLCSAMLVTACQSEGDRILQASACDTLSTAGEVARYYADGGLEERDDLSWQIDTLRMREISEEVARSRHGEPLREYREVVWRSLETQNVVAGGMGVAGPDWQALVARGIDTWDEFGCEQQMLTPAPWMPECDELEELRYQTRETCLTLEEREERRREHEEWLEEQRRAARPDDGDAVRGG